MVRSIFVLLIFLNSTLIAKSSIVVSIVPQKVFVEAIGGNKIDVSVMVGSGNSPHSYEPKPSQMKGISKADIYFTIGVEFEDIWLPKLSNQNKKMRILSIAKDIEKIDIIEHHHHTHTEDKHNKDPHIWTSPSNIKIIAKNIYNYLVETDKDNRNYYRVNYEKFLADIDNVDKEIKDILSQTPSGTKFMVFHPSWGYFAQDYNLTQVAVEVEGKSPKPKEIINIIKEAKEERVKVIFTQPEFSDKSAKIVAKEAGVKVVKVSPLNPNWSKNLINMAKEIANR